VTSSSAGAREILLVLHPNRPEAKIVYNKLLKETKNLPDNRFL
jgi:hypothetical protein